jgi:hypothetical protein
VKRKSLTYQRTQNETATGRQLALKKEVYAVVERTIEPLKVPTKEPPVSAKQRESKADAVGFLSDAERP